MWIGLLGPTQVRTVNGEVVVRAGKQRSLLAALAVSVGNVVAAETLAEAIWGPSLPRSWQVTLRNYVSRLRGCLGPGTGLCIVTRAPGYALQAGPDEIDLTMFDSVRQAGLAAAAEGDWPRACALLSRAEALWRGTPFADVPSRMVHEEHVRYLEAARLVVLETRIEAELRISLRGSAAVVPELHRLTARHPEREHFFTLLMLALYRSGRQAEALAVFHQTRRFTITEHGVDPGPELVNAHRRILAADPRLLGEPLVDLPWPSPLTAAVNRCRSRRYSRDTHTSQQMATLVSEERQLTAR